MTFEKGKKGKTTAVAKRGNVELTNQVADLATKLEEAVQSGRIGGEALLKLVNMLYDTPDDKLLELTEIPRAVVLPLAIMMTRVQAISKPKDVRLFTVFAKIYMQLMRSVGRRHFMVGSTLAEGQLTKEEEKEGEGYELPGEG